jgi:hypothetical protein
MIKTKDMSPQELKVEVENFMICVDEIVSDYYKKSLSNLEIPTMKVSEGNKYYKLVLNNSVWGFISKVNGELKGSPIKVGDLLMPANYRTPAKHSRGNIIDGTASYGVYGPVYLK